MTTPPRKKKVKQEVKKPILEGAGVTKRGIFTVRYRYRVRLLERAMEERR